MYTRQRITALALTFNVIAAINITISPVVTIPLCYMSNVADPLLPGILGNPFAEIRRIAWPLSPPVNVPITVNGGEPVGSPEIICMTGCITPPCLPIHTCSPGDLWWSTPFARGVVVVEPSGILRLPDTLTPPPPVMAFLWDNYAPLPSASPTPSSSPFPSVCPSLSNVTVSALPCPICQASGSAIVAYIFVGLLSVSVFFLLYCIIMMYRYTKCVYCQTVIRAGTSFLTHLKECPEHLKLFTPLTPVVTIVPPVTQLVFARSSRLVRPVASATKELLGQAQTESDEVDVVLETPVERNTT